MQPITILMADDDPDDQMMTKEAMEECRIGNQLRFVEDGEELMDYLQHRGKYSNPEDAPRPGLILLDLNMPKKDGREAIKEIRADDTLRVIPIVVLTTSGLFEDIYRSYDLGANTFIQKPVTFEGLVEMIRTLDKFFFEIVELPTDQERQ